MLRRLHQFFGASIPTMIVVGYLAVVLCYINQWDSLVWVTLIPPWIWAAGGMLVSFVSWILFKSRTSLIAFFLWFGTGLGLSDETRALAREFRTARTSADFTEEQMEKKLRIISINCAEESVEAAREALRYEPDIVFLQESPPRSELMPLLNELFEGQGSHVSYRRNAILARGRFSGEPIQLTGSSFGTASFRARLRLPDGRILDLANVHLERSVPRFDVWRSDARSRLTEARIRNRKRLRHIIENPDSKNRLHPIVVGGGFGTPPGDDVFRMLKKGGLEDAFVTSRSSGGNTFPGSIAVLRLDQFWMSDKLVPLKVDTHRSEHSDHRVLMCDFLID